jgi:hypothetical protein
METTTTTTIATTQDAMFRAKDVTTVKKEGKDNDDRLLLCKIFREEGENECVRVLENKKRKQ